MDEFPRILSLTAQAHADGDFDSLVIPLDDDLFVPDLPDLKPRDFLRGFENHTILAGGAREEGEGRSIVLHGPHQGEAGDGNGIFEGPAAFGLEASPVLSIGVEDIVAVSYSHLTLPTIYSV